MVLRTNERTMYMARTRRIKTDGNAHYHLMSRANDRRFLFEKGAVKTELVAALRRTAEFCGIAIKAYAAMGNHFHVVVKVTKPDEPVGTQELLRRVGVLRGEKAMRELSGRWDDLVAAGFDATLREEQDRLRARMHDVSEFVKLFKEVFDRIYKRDRKYCGSIWSGRFASTLIEDGVVSAAGGADRGGEDIRERRVRGVVGVFAGRPVPGGRGASSGRRDRLLDARLAACSDGGAGRGIRVKRMRRDSGRMGNVGGVGGKGAKAEVFLGAGPWGFGGWSFGDWVVLRKGFAVFGGLTGA